MLRPVATDDDRFYFDGWQQSRLLVQRCRRCEALRHPPSPSCPSCGDAGWDAVEVSGSGVVYSYVIPRKPSLGGLLPSPIVALIDLSDGVRVVSNLVGIEPAEVSFGLPVQLEFLTVEDGFRLPVFRSAR